MVLQRIVERSLPWKLWHCLKWGVRRVRFHPSALISGEYQGLSMGRNSKIGERCVMQLGPGAKIALGEGCWLYKDVEFRTEEQIDIGNRTTFQRNVTINGNVEIGADCLIAPNVFISSGAHLYQYIPELPIREQERRWSRGEAGSSHRTARIEIGDDCWIASNVVITPGVRVGKGCVIGANTVVNQSLPPYSIAVGAPVRVINRRLVWQPPIDLDATVTEAIPYLYQGFEISYLEDGISASMPSKVKIALGKPCEGSVIELILRSADAGALRYGANEFLFGVGTHTITVPISLNQQSPDGDHFLFDLSVSGNPQLLRCRLVEAISAAVTP